MIRASDEDNDLMIYKEDEEEGEASVETTWKMLIVDDEESVHTSTKLVLNEFRYDGKPLKIVSAFNSEEARNAIKSEKDLAVIFLDLSLEKKDIGLELIEYIRKEVNNQLVRIILLTGRIDKGLENEVVMKYDINDYKIKTELPAYKLYTTMISALRSYKDMVELARSRDDLKAVNDMYELKVKAVNASKTGIAITDSKGDITWINSSFVEMTGFDEAKVLGHIWEKNLIDYNVEKSYGKNDYVFNQKSGIKTIVEVKYEDVLDSAGNIKNCVIALHDITEREENKKNLYSDIEMAKKVQNNVLSPLLENNQVRIKGLHKPVEKLGGDIYYWDKLEENVYCVALIDVMGHGIATSLITMYIRALLPDAFKETQKPSKVMEILQKSIVEFNKSFVTAIDFFFTSVIFVVDLERNLMTYVSAGHPDVILIKKGKGHELLRSMTMPIGIFDLNEIPEGEQDISDITDIVLYTDGLSESKQVDLTKLLEEVIEEDSVAEEIIEKWFGIVEKEPFDDDVSLIWLQNKGVSDGVLY